MIGQVLGCAAEQCPAQRTVAMAGQDEKIGAAFRGLSTNAVRGRAGENFHLHRDAGLQRSQKFGQACFGLGLSGGMGFPLGIGNFRRQGQTSAGTGHRNGRLWGIQHVDEEDPIGIERQKAASGLGQSPGVFREIRGDEDGLDRHFILK